MSQAIRRVIHTLYRTAINNVRTRTTELCAVTLRQEPGASHLLEKLPLFVVEEVRLSRTRGDWDIVGGEARGWTHRHPADWHSSAQVVADQLVYRQRLEAVLHFLQTSFISAWPPPNTSLAKSGLPNGQSSGVRFVRSLLLSTAC